jgi:pimeloyl-ACP methyl ester carboxylesterase
MKPHHWNRSLGSRLTIAAGKFVVDFGELLLTPFVLRETNPAMQGLRMLAVQDLARMRREPVALKRPVLLLNGYHAWAGVIASLRASLIKLTSHNPRDFLDISYVFKSDLPTIRKFAIDEISQHFDINETTFDLVGVSMGGLVSRYACTQTPNDPRIINAHRIFTIATPHLGAKLARVIRPDLAAHDMLPGSDFLKQLNTNIHPRLHCYAQTNDSIVGARNTAPPAMHPIWSAGTWTMSHFTTIRNPIILADIARNLRGEEPLITTEMTAPTRD